MPDHPDALETALKDALGIKVRTVDQQEAAGETAEHEATEVPGEGGKRRRVAL